MFVIETRTGDPITTAGARLIPVARSVRLQLRRGGLIWNRAIGVKVDTGGGETLVPIRDRTRQLQLALLGAGLLGALVLRLAWRRPPRPSPEENSR